MARRRKPTAKKFGGKRRPLSLATRNKISRSLARVLGPTADFDPYEASGGKGGSGGSKKSTGGKSTGGKKSTGKTTAKKTTGGKSTSKKTTGNRTYVDTTTGNKVTVSTGKKPKGTNKPDWPDTTITNPNGKKAGGHRASAAYLDGKKIRNEPGYRQHLEERAAKLTDKKSTDNFLNSIDRDREKALADTGNAATNRANRRRYEVKAQQAKDMGLLDADGNRTGNEPTMPSEKDLPNKPLATAPERGARDNAESTREQDNAQDAQDNAQDAQDTQERDNAQDSAQDTQTRDDAQDERDAQDNAQDNAQDEQEQASDENTVETTAETPTEPADTDTTADNENVERSPATNADLATYDSLEDSVANVVNGVRQSRFNRPTNKEADTAKRLAEAMRGINTTGDQERTDRKNNALAVLDKIANRDNKDTFDPASLDNIKTSQQRERERQQREREEAQLAESRQDAQTIIDQMGDRDATAFEASRDGENVPDSTLNRAAKTDNAEHKQIIDQIMQARADRKEAESNKREQALAAQGERALTVMDNNPDIFEGMAPTSDDKQTVTRSEVINGVPGFEVEHNVTAPDTKDTPNTAREHLLAAIDAAGTDETLPMLTGVNVQDLGDGNLAITSTDRFRMVNQVVPGSITGSDGNPVLLSAKDLKEVAKGKFDALNITVDGDGNRANVNGTSVGTIDAQFPNTTPLIPKSRDTRAEATINKAQLMDVLDTATKGTRGARTAGIYVQFGDGKTRLTWNDKNGDSHYATIDTPNVPEGILTHVNAPYLKDIVKNAETTNGDLVISMDGRSPSSRPMLIHAPDTPENDLVPTTRLLMPIRIPDDVAGGTSPDFRVPISPEKAATTRANFAKYLANKDFEAVGSGAFKSVAARLRRGGWNKDMDTALFNKNGKTIAVFATADGPKFVDAPELDGLVGDGRVVHFDKRTGSTFDKVTSGAPTGSGVAVMRGGDDAPIEFVNASMNRAQAANFEAVSGNTGKALLDFVDQATKGEIDPAAKAPAKKAPAKKAPAKKSTAKKSTAKKSTAKKSTAKKKEQPKKDDGQQGQQGGQNAGQGQQDDQGGQQGQDGQDGQDGGQDGQNDGQNDGQDGQQGGQQDTGDTDPITRLENNLNEFEAAGNERSLDEQLFHSAALRNAKEQAQFEKDNPELATELKDATDAQLKKIEKRILNGDPTGAELNAITREMNRRGLFTGYGREGADPTRALAGQVAMGDINVNDLTPGQIRSLAQLQDDPNWRRRLRREGAQGNVDADKAITTARNLRTAPDHGMSASDWKKGNHDRTYINNWEKAAGLELEYGAGDALVGAKLNGEQISPQAARAIMGGGKVWVDNNTGELHINAGNDDYSADRIYDELAPKIADMLGKKVIKAGDNTDDNDGTLKLGQYTTLRGEVRWYLNGGSPRMVLNEAIASTTDDGVRAELEALTPELGKSGVKLWYDTDGNLNTRGLSMSDGASTALNDAAREAYKRHADGQDTTTADRWQDAGLPSNLKGALERIASGNIDRRTGRGRNARTASVDPDSLVRGLTNHLLRPGGDQDQARATAKKWVDDALGTAYQGRLDKVAASIGNAKPDDAAWRKKLGGEISRAQMAASDAGRWRAAREDILNIAREDMEKKGLDPRKVDEAVKQVDPVDESGLASALGLAYRNAQEAANNKKAIKDSGRDKGDNTDRKDPYNDRRKKKRGPGTPRKDNPTKPGTPRNRPKVHGTYTKEQEDAERANPGAQGGILWQEAKNLTPRQLERLGRYYGHPNTDDLVSLAIRQGNPKFRNHESFEPIYDQWLDAKLKPIGQELYERGIIDTTDREDVIDWMNNSQARRYKTTPDTKQNLAFQEGIKTGIHFQGMSEEAQDLIIEHVGFLPNPRAMLRDLGGEPQPKIYRAAFSETSALRKMGYDVDEPAKKRDIKRVRNADGTPVEQKVMPNDPKFDEFRDFLNKSLGGLGGFDRALADEYLEALRNRRESRDATTEQGLRQIRVDDSYIHTLTRRLAREDEKNNPPKFRFAKGEAKQALDMLAEHMNILRADATRPRPSVRDSDSAKKWLKERKDAIPAGGDEEQIERLNEMYTLLADRVPFAEWPDTLGTPDGDGGEVEDLGPVAKSTYSDAGTKIAVAAHGSEWDWKPQRGKELTEQDVDRLNALASGAAIPKFALEEMMEDGRINKKTAKAVLEARRKQSWDRVNETGTAEMDRMAAIITQSDAVINNENSTDDEVVDAFLKREEARYTGRVIHGDLSQHARHHGRSNTYNGRVFGVTALGGHGHESYIAKERLSRVEDKAAVAEYVRALADVSPGGAGNSLNPEVREQARQRLYAAKGNLPDGSLILGATFKGVRRGEVPVDTDPNGPELAEKVRTREEGLTDTELLEQVKNRLGNYADNSPDNWMTYGTTEDGFGKFVERSKKMGRRQAGYYFEPTDKVKGQLHNLLATGEAAAEYLAPELKEIRDLRDKIKAHWVYEPGSKASRYAALNPMITKAEAEEALKEYDAVIERVVTKLAEINPDQFGDGTTIRRAGEYSALGALGEGQFKDNGDGLTKETLANTQRLMGLLPKAWKDTGNATGLSMGSNRRAHHETSSMRIALSNNASASVKDATARNMDSLDGSVFVHEYAHAMQDGSSSINRLDHAFLMTEIAERDTRNNPVPVSDTGSKGEPGIKTKKGYPAYMGRIYGTPGLDYGDITAAPGTTLEVATMAIQKAFSIGSIKETPTEVDEKLTTYALGLLLTQK